jgi:hypothetical protein
MNRLKALRGLAPLLIVLAVYFMSSSALSGGPPADLTAP